MAVNTEHSPFRTVTHRVDLCVVGGGMTGLCAAVAAARRGARVVLMQDRPVLGGNASSEVGVHIIGADRVGKIPHVRETGLLEELRLKNLVRNPQASLAMWDLVVYDTVRYTPNLTLLLNCSCMDGKMDGPRLSSITGWQLSTQTWHVVHATVFADCSGDAILAPLTDAEHRMGREASDAFGESIAPLTADDLTMGMSYIFYTRDHDCDMPFVPFDWARKIKDCDALPWGEKSHAFWLYSPWWCELGGEHHSIEDSELLRDELFAYTMGIWDHIKNDCVHSEKARNAALEKIQFVPGRRESRRYMGAHMLTQLDIHNGGRFDDVVCHGGWTVDMHHPGGADSFAKYGEPPTEHHPAPCPFGIPYRTLYSRNVENLMFAGRVASCSHVAMSSTRVMGTCSVMGQALGTAAALAVGRGLMPYEVCPHMADLQQQLLADDVFLPGVRQVLSEVTEQAHLESSNDADPESVRDGVNRQVSSAPELWMAKEPFQRMTDAELAAYTPHSWCAQPGDQLAYHFDNSVMVNDLTLILDSNMERSIALRGPGWQEAFPADMPKRFRIDVRGRGGAWETAATVENNTQRHVRLRIAQPARALRLTLEETWGGEQSHVYGLFVNALHQPTPAPLS
jgi:hypothetical protein